MFRDFPEIMKQLTPDKCPSMREGKYQRSYFVDKDDKVGAILVTTPTNSMTYSPGKNTYDPGKYDKFTVELQQPYAEFYFRGMATNFDTVMYTSDLGIPINIIKSKSIIKYS